MKDSNANNISDIPNKIDRLINLKTLILNSNKLIALPSSITELTNLEVLDLSKNKEFDMMSELEKIKALRNLKVLKIVDVKIHRDDVAFIKKALPKTKIIVTVPEYLESLK